MTAPTTATSPPRARPAPAPAPNPARGPSVFGAPLRLVPMGAQPSLDGLRAVSVVLVILYHAGFSLVHGGFFGVEVFFVVSGYLITTLLREEAGRAGSVSLRGFWLRRARRLLPALVVVLAFVCTWSLLFAGEHVQLLRRDVLPALLYVGNWGQIFGSTPYFSSADPLLRHLWSLAVEEQWYLLWPVVFVGLQRWSGDRVRRLGGWLAGSSVAIMIWSAWLAGASEARTSVLGHGADRFNFLYLNTLTRSSGLLLGAGLAMVWRPWTIRRAGAADLRAGRMADGSGLAALSLVVLIAVTRGGDILFHPSLYRWWLPIVTVLSAVAVAACVHPSALILRKLLGHPVLAAVGQRSYGLYLWHWPVFVFAGVRQDHARFLPAMLVTAGLSELCFRLVETPVRRGALGRGWARVRGEDPSRQRTQLAGVVAAAVVVVAVLGVGLARYRVIDPSIDQREVAFDASAASAATGAVPSGDRTAATTIAGAAASSPALPAPSGAPAVLPVPTTVPVRLPRGVVVVGDSTARALADNAPSGIESTFTITDGAISGCGIWDTGDLVTARDFRRNFGECVGWEDRWASAARRSGAPLALVVIGAWDVFDVRLDGRSIPFGSSESDARFREHLQRGVDALVGAGVHVALLEVPCMRPIDAKGAGVPALPERGDDARVAHVNELMREVAAANPDHVTFVSGPAAFCDDPVIATDVGYRWDGVHVYKPGSKLIFETIAPALLAIPLATA